MVQRDVDDDAISSQEVSGLPMDVEEIELLFALEDVQSPVLICWFPSFGRLVILQDDSLERLCLGGQLARGVKVRHIFLFGHIFIFFSLLG